MSALLDTQVHQHDEQQHRNSLFTACCTGARWRSACATLCARCPCGAWGPCPRAARSRPCSLRGRQATALGASPRHLLTMHDSRMRTPGVSGGTASRTVARHSHVWNWAAIRAVLQTFACAAQRKPTTPAHPSTVHHNAMCGLHEPCALGHRVCTTVLCLNPGITCTGRRRPACCAACCRVPRVPRLGPTTWLRRCCAPQGCHPQGPCRTGDRLQGRPRRGEPCSGGCCPLGGCRAHTLGTFATQRYQRWRRSCPSGRRRARRQQRWRHRRRSRRKAHRPGQAPTSCSGRCEAPAATLLGWVHACEALVS